MTSSTPLITAVVGRRGFLRVAGASAATATLVLAGCGKDDPAPTTTTPTVALGASDAGLMNYVYLIEQLKVAFYQKVLAAPAGDLSAEEKAYLADLRDHAIVYRETWRNQLAGSAALTFPFDFSSLTLTSRAGVLSAARTFEDQSAAGLYGLLGFVSDDNIRTLLLKQASVVSRHGALLHDLLTPGSFADATVVGTNGQLLSLTPAQVLTATAGYYPLVRIDASKLPTA